MSAMDEADVDSMTDVIARFWVTTGGKTVVLQSIPTRPYILDQLHVSPTLTLWHHHEGTLGHH